MWWFGIFLEVLSTLLGTVGKQLVRFSELVKATRPRQSRLLFMLGLFVNTICGPAIDMAAYSFAPQSLIAPFGGLDVVWNAVCAPFLLNEKLTLRRGAGCVLIVIGTVTAGVFGSHKDEEYTVEYLEDVLINYRVLIYLGIFLVWYLFNVCFLMRRARGNPLRGISLGMTAGTIAGNMFCVKAAVEIIQYCIDNWTTSPMSHWLPYVVFSGALFFSLWNLIYMTRGLQEFEALFMVTVYEGSMIVSGCISGSVVLLDLKDLEEWRIVVYCLSVSFVALGMAVVFSNETLTLPVADRNAQAQPESDPPDAKHVVCVGIVPGTQLAEPRGTLAKI